MFKPTCILQEFVIQTYLWVLAGRLCGIEVCWNKDFITCRKLQTSLTSPNDVEKGNCECVRLVMLVSLLAYFILLIYMRTSDM